MSGRSLFLVTAGLLQAVVLLVLPACGGGGSCTTPTASPLAVMYSVPTLDAEGNYYGITQYTCGAPTLVRISQETPTALIPRVIAHEMLHTAGLVEHEASPQCFLYKDAYEGQPIDPCSSEVDRLRDVPGQITITVPDPAILEACRDCAVMWNDFAGREVFVVVDGTPPRE